MNIRKHFRDNKKVYLAGTAGVVIGAGVAYVGLQNKALVGIRPIQVLTWKSKQTVEVFIEALGDPGNIIQDTTTGVVYASQGQAARELDLTASDVSKHLAGKTNHVKGHIFEKIGKASISEAA